MINIKDKKFVIIYYVNLFNVSKKFLVNVIDDVISDILSSNSIKLEFSNMRSS